ncbi:hypothetical protein D3C84_514670 [compost metagenome]
MQLQGTVRRVAVQVDGDRDDGQVGQQQGDDHQLPGRQGENTGHEVTSPTRSAHPRRQNRRPCCIRNARPANATTSRTWMKPPRVYAVISPSAHRRSRRITIAPNMSAPPELPGSCMDGISLEGWQAAVCATSYACGRTPGSVTVSEDDGIHGPSPIHGEQRYGKGWPEPGIRLLEWHRCATAQTYARVAGKVIPPVASFVRDRDVPGHSRSRCTSGGESLTRLHDCPRTLELPSSPPYAGTPEKGSGNLCRNCSGSPDEIRGKSHRRSRMSSGLRCASALPLIGAESKSTFYEPGCSLAPRQTRLNNLHNRLIYL